MPSFPNDPPFRSRRVRATARGDPYNLTLLELGSHTGTHVDPPVHFLPDGVSVDRLDLDLLNGPCEVVHLPANVRRIGAAELAGVPPGCRRLLLRTSNSDRWAARLAFFPDYVAVDLSGAERLRELGVGLLGVDALSVENDPRERYPVHRELLSHGIVILEGLLLAEAPAGPADLRCLPLRLTGGDGGPSRVLLEYP